MKQTLEHTQSHRNDEVYSMIWESANFMFTSTWVERMLKPLCDCSEVTVFLFNTAVPTMQEILSNPAKFTQNVERGLMDSKTPEHVKEVYELLEKLVSSANYALTRRDINDDVRACAEETLKLMEYRHFCEALRCLAISSMTTRLCLRVGIPRIVKTFEHDKQLDEEKMNFDIVKLFASP